MATRSDRVNRLPHAERRRQILDETVLLIGPHGYCGFSIHDLADRCDLTVAGVLHHVRTKVGLLVALLEDRDRRDVEVAAEAAGVVVGAGRATLGAGM